VFGRRWGGDLREAEDKEREGRGQCMVSWCGRGSRGRGKGAEDTERERPN